MKELEAIKNHYGRCRAKRSKVPLMNHIIEGLRILDEIEASEWAKRAYCLHPLVQEDADFDENFDSLTQFHPWVVALIVEYRSVANDYLSQAASRSGETIRLSPLRDVNDMLIADKVQNYKDFLIHHYGKHERSSRLDEYFQQWLDRLGISESRYLELAGLISPAAPVG